MTRVMFGALNELKSDIIVVDKFLKQRDEQITQKMHIELKMLTCKTCHYYYYHIELTC